MKSGRGWLLLGVAIGVVLLAVLAELFVSPSQVQLKITGVEGMRVTGTCDADGEQVDFGPGPVPNTVTAHGHLITFRIESVGEAGPLTVEVVVDDESKGSVTAKGPYTVVRGTVKNGKVEQAAERAGDVHQPPD